MVHYNSIRYNNYTTTNLYVLWIWSMFKTEREYQSSVTKELRMTAWIYKIPDVNMQIKPFDIVLVKHWIPIAIELKICNLKKWLTYEQAYSMLRPNQIASLQSFLINWGISRVRVYNKAEDKEYKFDFKFLNTGNNIEL